MIERIFIPTVHRVDQQITFNHLPDELKGRVTMVVQRDSVATRNTVITRLEIHACPQNVSYGKRDYRHTLAYQVAAASVA